MNSLQCLFLVFLFFNQIKYITNIYFILQAVLSLFPQFSTVEPVSALVPIIFVILFSMCFDLGEDFLRYLRDRTINTAKTLVLNGTQWVETECQHVKAGDIVCLKNKNDVCADIVLLSFTSRSAYAYIETANLDGERHLKPKISIFEKSLTIHEIVQKYPDFTLEYQPNVEFLERFDGIFTSVGVDNKEYQTKVGISNFIPRSTKIQNTTEVIGLVVYTGNETKIMKNTKKRRVKSSTLEKKMKTYILYLLLVLVVLLIFIATYSVVKRQQTDDFILDFVEQEYSYGVQWIFAIFTWFIILNGIVPISLIITLQLSKTLLTYFYLLEMKKDEIEVKINTMSIHEELGQIEYVLSDKTGTLTQNKMVLKYFQMMTTNLHISEGVISETESSFKPFDLKSNDQKEIFRVNFQNDLKRLYFLGLNCCHECFSRNKNENEEEDDLEDEQPEVENKQKQEEEFNDEIRIRQESPTYENRNSGESQRRGDDIRMSQRRGILNETDDENPNHQVAKSKKIDLIERDRLLSNPELIKGHKSNKNSSVFDSKKSPEILNLKTLKNLKDLENAKYVLIKENLEFQGPSPDEIAILRASKNFCGFLFKGATINEAVIMEETGKEIVVKLDYVLKFDSIRKMMSVVVEIDNKIVLVCKGADSKIKSRLKTNKSDFEIGSESTIHQKSDQFILEGLRVMYVAIRILSKEEWASFCKRISEANNSNDYDADISKISDDLENNLTLVGATGIEDKLQENLEKTIVQIQQANIKLWVITGDKMETAENIAYSAKLFKRDKKLITLKTLHDLKNIDSTDGSQNLIIDGEFFGELLLENGEDLRQFREIIMNFNNVVFSRTNANQKVEVVKIVKSFGKKTLAIGDGANDVNMIQEAHVGIGISGEEGKQASNSADFVITKFEDLSELLFNHGRLSYSRMSDLVLFFFYKSILFVTPMFLFGFFNDFSGTLFYIDYYGIFYDLVFTSLVASARSIYDKDIEGFGKNQRKLEILTYYIGQKDVRFNLKNFIFWIFAAILEICLLFYFVYGAFVNSSYSHGFNVTYEFASMLVFSVFVFHQTTRVICLTNIFLILQTILYTTGYWVFVIYFVATNSQYFGGMWYIFEELWECSGYLIPFFFIMFVLLLNSFVYYKIKKETYF